MCFSISGYNGNFGSDAKAGQVTRKNAAGTRDDGTDYVYRRTSSTLAFTSE